MSTVKVMPVTEREVTITLSETEAGYLMAILKRIGGPPAGPRGIFSSNPDSIAERLEKEGVSPKGRLEIKGYNERDASWGGLYFC